MWCDEEIITYSTKDNIIITPSSVAKVLQNSGTAKPILEIFQQTIMIEILGENVTFLEMHFWSENVDFVQVKLYSSPDDSVSVYEVSLSSFHHLTNIF